MFGHNRPIFGSSMKNASTSGSGMNSTSGFGPNAFRGIPQHNSSQSCNHSFGIGYRFNSGGTPTCVSCGQTIPPNHGLSTGNANNSSPFGNPASSLPSFGIPAHAVGTTNCCSLNFGSLPTVQLFGSDCVNTPFERVQWDAAARPVGTTIPFKPAAGTDTMMKNNIQCTINTYVHCISCMTEYERKSLDELRFEDYSAGRETASPSIHDDSLVKPTRFGAESNAFEANRPFGTTALFKPAVETDPIKPNPFAQRSAFESSCSSQRLFRFGQQQAEQPPNPIGQSLPATGLFPSSTAGTYARFGPASTPQTQTIGFCFGIPQQTNRINATKTALWSPAVECGFNFGSKPKFGSTDTTPSNGAFGTGSRPFGSSQSTYQGTMPDFFVSRRATDKLEQKTEPKAKKIDDLLDALEENVAEYAKKEKNPSKRCQLLKDLQAIVELLKQDLTKPACKRCFFSRLFGVCDKLEAKEDGLKLLKGVLGSCVRIEQWFVCERNACKPDKLDHAALFANFIRLTNGWAACPETVTKLMWHLASEESFYILCDIVHAQRIGYASGAQETFNVILQALKRLKPSDVSKIFHPCLAVLAIRLQNDTSNDEDVDALFDLLTLIKPEQLTELVVHLGQLNETSAKYKRFMKRLGLLVDSTYLFRLDSEQFIKVVEAYDVLGEREVVQSFWKSLCTRCIRIWGSVVDLPCHLCKVLRSSTLHETTQTVLNGLVSVPDESKEAIICALRKLQLNRDGVNLAEVIGFILQLEDFGILSEDEIFTNVIQLLSCLKPQELCHLSCAPFQDKRYLVNMSLSTMKKIYGWLLDRIANLHSDVFNAIQYPNLLLRGFAWFGSLNQVKTMCSLLTDGKEKSTMILNSLKADTNGLAAASSKAFNREIFNFLMLECADALGNLADRASHYSECFELIALSERRLLPNSTETCFTLKWTALTKNLTFLETVEAVTAIFDREIIKQEQCLKELPLCWKVFQQLCENVISKWDYRVVKQHLTESHVVSLMQSFFWIGDDKGIVDFYSLIVGLPCSVSTLAGVLCAIIHQKMTFELAASSQQGLLTMKDLIENRIKKLEWEKGLLWGISQTKQACIGTEAQKELNDLHAMRRHILKKIDQLEAAWDK